MNKVCFQADVISSPMKRLFLIVGLFDSASCSDPEFPQYFVNFLDLPHNFTRANDLELCHSV